MTRLVLSTLLLYHFCNRCLGAGLSCSVQHTMKPNIGKPQSIADNPPPYKLYILNSRGEAVKYYKDEIYTIIMNGTSYFRAFLIQARISTHQGHVIGFLRAGEFIYGEHWNEEGIQIQKCPPVFNDSITNLNIAKKRSIDVQWRARRNDGPIQFVITIIKDHNMFWSQWSPESGLILPDNDAKFTEHVSLNSKGDISDGRKPGETKVIVSADAKNMTSSKSTNEKEETDIKSEFQNLITPLTKQSSDLTTSNPSKPLETETPSIKSELNIVSINFEFPTPSPMEMHSTGEPTPSKTIPPTVSNTETEIHLTKEPTPSKTTPPTVSNTETPTVKPEILPTKIRPSTSKQEPSARNTEPLVPEETAATTVIIETPEEAQNSEEKETEQPKPNEPIPSSTIKISPKVTEPPEEAQNSEEKETEQPNSDEPIPSSTIKIPSKVTKITIRTIAQLVTTAAAEQSSAEAAEEESKLRGQEEKDDEKGKEKKNPSTSEENVSPLNDETVISTTPPPLDLEPTSPQVTPIRSSPLNPTDSNPAQVGDKDAKVATSSESDSSSEKEKEAEQEKVSPVVTEGPQPPPVQQTEPPIIATEKPAVVKTTPPDLVGPIFGIFTTIGQAKPAAAVAHIDENGNDEVFHSSGEKITRKAQSFPSTPKLGPEEDNYCNETTCLNNGTCLNLQDDKTFQCLCTKKWLGERCSIVNHCADQPCLHGGNCTSDNTESGGFLCRCFGDWTGPTCDTPCPSNNCQNGGTCIVKNTEIGCNCKPGWTGPHCEIDIDECLSSPCLNDGTCVDKTGFFECKCIKGYMGERCHRPCQDIYHSCSSWRDEDKCETMRPVTKFFDMNCAKTCGQCIYDNETVHTKMPLPPILEPLHYLMGTWSVNQTTAKRFPVDFPDASLGYYEELKFMIANLSMFGIPYINYTSMAINNANPTDEQRNLGFMTLKPIPEPIRVGIMSTGNDGITVIEEGILKGTEMELTVGYFAFFPSVKKPTKLTRKFSMNGDYLQQSVERTGDDGNTDSFTIYYAKKETTVSY